VEFDRLKSRFWAPDASGAHPPLTQADINRAQVTLGVRLPSEYLELLGAQNGGDVAFQFDAYPTNVPTSWADDHVWLRSLAGIGPAGSTWPPSITQSPDLIAEWEMPERLVLLDGDGHYWIALDYRDVGDDGAPSVAWIDNEADQDIELAPDFRTFIEGLVPLESFDDGVAEEVLPIVHVRHPATNATYCGSSLEGASWVDRDMASVDNPRACPDCIRLMREWDAAGR
jgi:hypothetical protein